MAHGDFSPGISGKLELCPIGTEARGFRVRYSRSLHLRGVAGIHILCQGNSFPEIKYKYIVSNEGSNEFLYCIIN
jgi:hypothetical protein